jgi:hypothetical protein
MKDFTGWKRYKGVDGVTIIGIQSQDGRESRLMIDKEVAAWLAIPGNSAKLV